MARPGRRRKDRLAVVEIAPTATPERMMQRIAIVGTATVQDRERGRRAAWEVWDGTLLGALAHHGVISEAARIAGDRYDSLAKRYGDMMRAWKIHHEPPPDEEREVPTPDQEADEFREVREMYDAATAAIGTIPYRRAVADVLRSHICDQQVWEAFSIRYRTRMDFVRTGFENLARFYKDA